MDKKLVGQLSTLDFAINVQNAELIGGPRIGKTHLATGIGVAGVAAKGKRVRFYSTVDLINEFFEKKKRGDKAGRTASAIMRKELVILHEMAYPPLTKPVVLCCFTCAPKCTSTPEW